MAGLRRILRDRRAATAIEYSLIAALIAVAAIVAMRGLGNRVGNTFENVTEIVESR